MPEQVDPRSADPAAAKPEEVSGNGARRDPFWDRDDVLEVGPLHKEIIGELIWACEQEARGAFIDYAGKYLAIVHKTVLAVGGDIERMRAEAAVKAGVPPERVAIHHVDAGEW
jgi:hypothetical protein